MDHNTSEYIQLAPVPEQTAYPVSPAQQRMYILQQINPGSTAYNLPMMVQTGGEPDPARMETAIRQLIHRHESLRTSFHLNGDALVQVIHPVTEFHLEVAEAAPGQMAVLQSQFIQPFDLSRAPLFRAKLLKLTGENGSLLLMDMHHIISDGFSIGIITRELMDLYQGRTLPELRIQYKDYCAWIWKWMQSGDFARQESYWRNTFAGEIPLLNLPLDFERRAGQAPSGGTYRIIITRNEVTRNLESFALRRRVTLNTLFIAVYSLLLAKYSGQDEIIVGSVVSGRNHPELRHLVGIFVNTLPLRIEVPQEVTFTQYLAGVARTISSAYDNQDYPFEMLVQALGLGADRSRNPLVDTMLVFHSEFKGRPGRKSVETDYICDRLENNIPMMDLALGIIPGDSGELYGTFDYDANLFRRETILRMAEHWLNLLEQVIANPEARLWEMGLLTDQEKRRILIEFNNTQDGPPFAPTFTGYWDAQVHRSPKRLALVHDAQSLTYLELDEKANQLARVLRNKGAGPGTVTGLLVGRSPEMFIGLLGILKAGAAYLPLDPEYPAERIEYILRDSHTGLLVTGGGLCAPPGYDGEVLEIKPELLHEAAPNLDPGHSADDPAYVIYTSGSTGRPKGVMIEHRAVTNFIEAMCAKLPFLEGKTILCATTISFDIFGLETLVPLSRGLTVILAGAAGQKDPYRLSRLIREQRVAMIQLTPSRLQLLLQNAELSACFRSPDLTEIIIGGEAFPEASLRELQSLTAARIYNVYGPTETTIWSTIQEVTNAREVTIGKPIANTQVYVLDPAGLPVPVGVPGELWIGGLGLARGYLNRPELTAEKFVPNPFLAGLDGTLPGAFQQTPGQATLPQIYRTGDRVKWLEDGTIKFLGRMDRQVKIRGYRIELGEIENRLLQHEAVLEAAAIDREGADGYKYLAAYFVARGEITGAELRDHLARSLPEYMLPAVFVPLDKIPKTPNGKIDRKALPQVDGQWNQSSPVAYQAPETLIEKNLAAIWQNVLQCDQVGIHDNFFEVGGNSFLLVIMHAQINALYPGKVEVTDLFSYPTIARLARFIEKGSGGPMIQLEPLLLPAEYFGEGAGNEECLFRFRLGEPRFASLKAIAARLGVFMADLLLGAYCYLLAELSERDRVQIQTVLAGAGAVLPLEVDLGQVADLSGLFGAIHSQVNSVSMADCYSLEELDKILVTLEPNHIIPLFAYPAAGGVFVEDGAFLEGGAFIEGEVPHKVAARDVDGMMFEITNLTDSEVVFVCSFRNTGVRRDQAEKLIQAYLKLIEIIIERMDEHE
ncbi:MAG: amino acid adenylation domain-containing protein [Firmicutes bacterium]|nr:amino acid adenylation domain-containing protein [Bacillota bacterium]